MYRAEIRQNLREPACTVPPRDARQAGARTPSRRLEKLQLLCKAGSRGCYAMNGTMEHPADETGKSGVQQAFAKSLKGCSWRKDKRGWQLDASQKAELKLAKLEKTKRDWEQEPDYEFDYRLLHVTCVLLDCCSAPSWADIMYETKSSAKCKVQEQSFNTVF